LNRNLVAAGLLHFHFGLDGARGQLLALEFLEDLRFFVLDGFQKLHSNPVLDGAFETEVLESIKDFDLKLPLHALTFLDFARLLELFLVQDTRVEEVSVVVETANLEALFDARIMAYLDVKDVIPLSFEQREGYPLLKVLLEFAGDAVFHLLVQLCVHNPDVKLLLYHVGFVSKDVEHF